MMKNNGKLSENLHKLFMAAVVLVMVSVESLNAQCVVNSTDGYNVNMMVIPKRVLVSTINCSWGYNFNYELDYLITFTGSNIPSSLWTLQGNVVAAGYSKNFYDLPNKGGSGTTTSVGNSFTNKSDCNTVTVASLNPSIEIIIQGPGIPYQTIHCPILALPV